MIDLSKLLSIIEKAIDASPSPAPAPAPTSSSWYSSSFLSQPSSSSSSSSAPPPVSVSDLPGNASPDDVQDWQRDVMMAAAANTPTGAVPDPSYGIKEESKQKSGYDLAAELQRNAEQDWEASLRPEGAKTKTHRMTWEQYNALSPLQRSAVDYNGMLVQAVRKDMRMNRKGRYDNVTDEQRAAYDKNVESMFGEDMGSDKYAPETMAVLQQLGIKNREEQNLDTGGDNAGGYRGADLDDYLDLRTVITTKDLRGMRGQNATEPGGRLPAELREMDLGDSERGTLIASREDMVLDAAARTQELQQALTKGNEMLQTFQAEARSDRQAALAQWGAVKPGAVADVGFGPKWDGVSAPTDMNTYFQALYDALAKRQDTEINTREDVEANFDKLGYSSEDRQKFWDYVNVRTQNALNYGQPLGVNSKAKYETDIAKFRQDLGFDTMAPKMEVTNPLDYLARREE